MKSTKSMTPKQLYWLYLLNDDDYCHFDPWTHEVGHFDSSGHLVGLTNWMDTLARRIADAAGGYAKLNFNPATKPFTPDPGLLKKYPQCLDWSKNPSFPPKAWEQMAMSWGYSIPPFFENYLHQKLKDKSFIIPRHESRTDTLSNSFMFFTTHNKNQLIKKIASKPND